MAEKAYEHLCNGAEMVNSFRSVPPQQTGKSESNQMLATGKHNVNYEQFFLHFFNFNLFISGPYKPFSDGSKVFTLTVR